MQGAGTLYCHIVKRLEGRIGFCTMRRTGRPETGDRVTCENCSAVFNDRITHCSIQCTTQIIQQQGMHRTGLQVYTSQTPLTTLCQTAKCCTSARRMLKNPPFFIRNDKSPTPPPPLIPFDHFNFDDRITLERRVGRLSADGCAEWRFMAFSARPAAAMSVPTKSCTSSVRPVSM